MKRIAIIGGGAAGLFAAINIKLLSSEVADVTIFEASSRPLGKVLISGGGRCNLTNTFQSGMHLSKIYPRGEKLMRNLFKIFDHNDTMEWFEREGVKLTAEEDGCIFPASQDAGEIVDCLLSLAKKHDIAIRCRHRISRIREVDEEGFDVQFNESGSEIFDIVVATTGGSPRRDGLSLYSALPLTIVQPVPSLFSLTIPRSSITDLMGAVVEGVELRLRGTKIRAVGDLLITHWGISGPAVLRLSSYAALKLKESDYRGTVAISWCCTRGEELIAKELHRIIAESGRKLVASVPPFSLTRRVWEHILVRSDISPERRWAELGSRGINRIIATLNSDDYTIEGRGSHKEEFVTAGGISTSCVNPTTMQARLVKNLYLAGEVLNVDGITGGYNLQAAWSMGYVAAKNITK
ncbi:MAG: aminoacetone oxidase family FAD-binding enzyme [Rikenellaceae bacterium]